MTDIRTRIARLYADVDDPAKTSADLGSYFSDDFRDYDRHPAAPAFLTDKQAHLGFFDALKAGFSDFRHHLNLVEQTEAGKVVVYWSFEGTHTGAFYGIPASGIRARCNGLDLYTVADGQFTEQRHAEDVAGLMAQITR